MTKFYFCGGSDQYWTATNANTINGAKAIASKTYQQSVGEKVGEGDAERIEKVAVKYGYDKWQTAS